MACLTWLSQKKILILQECLLGLVSLLIAPTFQKLLGTAG